VKTGSTGAPGLTLVSGDEEKKFGYIRNQRHSLWGLENWEEGLAEGMRRKKGFTRNVNPTSTRQREGWKASREKKRGKKSPDDDKKSRVCLLTEIGLGRTICRAKEGKKTKKKLGKEGRTLI